MFYESNITIIAQTGVEVFEDVLSFTAIARTTTNNGFTQIVLATTNGLFASTTANGITDATNQATANWQQVAKSELGYFNGISTSNTDRQKTVWPFSLTINKACQSFFENGIIYQLNKTSGNLPTFVPDNFNNRDNSIIFDPIQFLWSDSARRLFITNKKDTPSKTNMIVVQPFNTFDECDTMPLQLTNKILDDVNHFYWIDLINNTGAIFAGTNCGVVTLQ